MAKSPPIDDAIFFHAAQVCEGTEFVHWGRLAPGSRWRVVRITTYEPSKAEGSFKRKRVPAVTRLRDVVTLARLAGGQLTNDYREGAFTYLSYSAIWRLA